MAQKDGTMVTLCSPPPLGRLWPRSGLPLGPTGRLIAVLAACLGQAGCFGIIREPARHYFVLNVAPTHAEDDAPVAGLVRVRDLDTESVYDRLPMVVRRSPYELAFRPRDTWAVRPGRMVSDALGRALARQRSFAGVTRELSERRPDYLLAGDLHLLEVDETTPQWQARLAMTLQLSATDSGAILWTGDFDERQPVPGHDYAAAVQAMSEALGRITDAALAQLRAVQPGAAKP